jgi:superfamily II DNA/RNA helicase
MSLVVVSISRHSAGHGSGKSQTLGSYDIMVATPMRLVTLLRENVLDLSSVEVSPC